MFFWPKNMAPVTMATEMKNKNSGINYFFLRQKKQPKKISSKSVTMCKQPCFMVTEKWYKYVDPLFWKCLL